MLKGPDSKTVQSPADDSARLWSLEVFGSAQIPDVRLQRRLLHTATLLVNNPQVSVLQACGCPKNSKGTYRFWSNERVTEEALKESVYQSTARQCEDLACILVPQDTTALQFKAVERIQGLGPISDNAHTRGLLLHSAIALREDGTPIGVLHHQLWAREPQSSGVSEKNPQRPFEEKESFKWVQGMQGVRWALETASRGGRKTPPGHPYSRSARGCLRSAAGHCSAWRRCRDSLPA